MSAMPDHGASALFISPHFDDVALSCGGTVALFASRGVPVHILTLFGGAPPEPLSPFARQQHRWRGLTDEAVIDIRRAEERAAAAMLGAQASWLEIPDAIYRDARYTSDDELFGALHPDDAPLIDTLLSETERFLDSLPHPVTVFVPLAIGNHVDHQIAYLLGQRLAQRRFSVWGYEDMPYAATERGREAVTTRLQSRAGPPWVVLLTEELFRARLLAVQEYRSQVPFIFRNLGDAEEILRRYALEAGQGRLAERFWTVGASDYLDPWVIRP